jgi:hypothetical protein
VELFLRTSCSYLKISLGKKDPSFKKLWKLVNDELEKRGAERLPYESEICNDMRQERNTAQHRGHAPSRDKSRHFTAFVEAFLKSASSAIFKINIHELNVTTLIQDEELRLQLRKAEKAIENNNIEEAIKRLSIAHFMIKNDLSSDDEYDSVLIVGARLLGEMLKKIYHIIPQSEDMIIEDIDAVVELLHSMDKRIEDLSMQV